MSYTNFYSPETANANIKNFLYVFTTKFYYSF